MTDEDKPAPMTVDGLMDRLEACPVEAEVRIAVPGKPIRQYAVADIRARLRRQVGRRRRLCAQIIWIVVGDEVPRKD
jgi:hypothetical protein